MEREGRGGEGMGGDQGVRVGEGGQGNKCNME